MRDPRIQPLPGRLLWLAVFAVAMGLLEAVCVIYLRRLLLPAGAEITQIVQAVRDLRIEVLREACTLAMLLAVACLAASRAGARTAAFFLMFGIWDIFYYVGLWLLSGWPTSLLEWDCLFLIPVPWYGPVLAPVLISGYFVLACGLYLVAGDRGRPLRLSWPVLALQAAGFSVWYLSFVRDSRRITERGYDGVAYAWILLLAGAVICGAGLALSLRRRPPARGAPGRAERSH